MLGSDINATFRRFTAETDPTGRWADADVYDFINQAQNLISLQLEWPVVHLNAMSVANTQEYTMPEIVKIERVYLAGQPCVPTDIATLEGLQIEYYDQNSTQTPNTPQWNSAVFNTYPVTNTQVGYPNGVSPYYVGQRPVYYVNGGNIGFVPIPAGAYSMDIWGIGLPTPFSTGTETCSFPSFFKPALAHKAAQLAFEADSQLERAQMQSAHFMEWMPQLRTWKYDLVKNKSRGPRPITYRHFFRRGSIMGDD